MVAITLDELLAYTDEEREKWRRWLQSHPDALGVRLQPDGRFSSVGSLVDHIFLVEARHLARLERQPVPEASAVQTGNADALFRYAGSIRQALRAYILTLDEVDLRTPRDFAVQSGTFRMTPRKLLLHICLHETRHWAQIALGVRQAGLQPPGNHDLFYSRAME